MTIEFTLLSRLLGDPVYENVARRAVRALWEHRHRHTGLVGKSTHVWYMFCWEVNGMVEQGSYCMGDWKLGDYPYKTLMAVVRAVQGESPLLIT